MLNQAVCVCREGCSSEEFEALVQRNMAANCGMNFAFMANFLHTILHREERMLRCASSHCATQGCVTMLSCATLKQMLLSKQCGATRGTPHHWAGRGVHKDWLH